MNLNENLYQVVIMWNDPIGKKSLEAKLKKFPEGPCEEAAKLIEDYNRHCCERVSEYCNTYGIKITNRLELVGVVSGMMSKNQIEECNDEGMISVEIDDPRNPAIRIALKH